MLAGIACHRRAWTTAAVVVLLASAGAWALPATASSTTGQLIYVAAPSAGPWQLMSTAPSGGAGIPLFSDPARSFFAPAVTPGGRTLAFGWAIASQNSSHIGIYHLDAGGPPTLYDAGTNSHDDSPTWNGTGTLIAFARDTGQRDEIWLMNADGSGQHAVPNAVGTNPVFSPSGAQIVFESVTAVPALMSINIDGSGLAALPGGSGGQAPNWSPDGHTLVFSRPSSPGASTLDLYRLPASGGAASKVETGLGFKSALTTFSPDSKTVFFSNLDVSKAAGNVYSVPIEGGIAKQVTSGNLNLAPAYSAPSAVPDATPPGPVTAIPVSVTPPANPATGGTTPVAIGAGAPLPVLPAGPVTAPISNKAGGVVVTPASGFTAQTSGGVIALLWNNPRDTDFAGSVVTRDGLKVYDGRAGRLLDRVAPGSTHTYTVTAYDASGNKGAAVSKKVRALAAPTVRIATPTSMATVATPFKVSWSAAAGTKDYTVQYAFKRWTGKAWVLSGYQPWLTHTTARSAVFGVGNLPRMVIPGSTLVFRAFATSTFDDPTSYSPAAVAVVPADESIATAGAGWTSVPDARFWLGRAKRSGVRGATLDLKVTGESVSVIGQRCVTCGQFRVYEGGVLRATVDTRATRTQWRATLYTWPAPGVVARDLKIVVVGTRGRPTVFVDGFAISR